jgi:hypothetical protein
MTGAQQAKRLVSAQCSPTTNSWWWPRCERARHRNLAGRLSAICCPVWVMVIRGAKVSHGRQFHELALYVAEGVQAVADGLASMLAPFALLGPPAPLTRKWHSLTGVSGAPPATSGVPTPRSRQT